MKDRQQPIGGECAEEKALAAPAIINELASNGTVHTILGTTQFTNRELGSILTIAVGQDTIGGGRPVQTYDRSLRCVKTTDRLNGDGSIRSVLDFDYNFPPRLIPKQPYGTDEIR